MLGQMSLGSDGQLRDKVQTAIKRLQAFEPPEGYYVAFSGGKDSQCVYHLCQMAGVKFDAHYAITSVDPPELVRFIRENYPDVEFTRQYYPDGKPITMWSLIAEHTIPPTRKARYCCASLKEPGGGGRIVVTGVRWAESANRKNNHDVVDIRGKKAIKTAEQNGVQFRTNKHGELIMNDDNDDARRTVESCYRTRKTMVNPIVDWTDEDVWEFLNSNNIPHCCLYDEGFTRLGCIGCPLAGSEKMRKDFERWPKYKQLYIKAFQRMVDKHPGEIKIFQRTYEPKYSIDTNDPNKIGGGAGMVSPNARRRAEAEGRVIAAETPCFDGGSKWEQREDMAGNEWVEVPQNKVGGGTARSLDLDGKPQRERDGRSPGDYLDGRSRNSGGQTYGSTAVESGWEEAVLTDIGGEMLEHYIWQSGTMNTPPRILWNAVHRQR